MKFWYKKLLYGIKYKFRLKWDAWKYKGFVLKNKIFKKWGYMRINDHEYKLNYLREDFNRSYSELENLKLDRLIDAIRTVNMVKVRAEFDNSIKWFENSDTSQKLSVKYIEDIPPEPRLYQYRVSMDISKLQRIYQEMQLSQNSYEFEYLKKSIWRDIEQNLDALIKLELGVR